MGGFRGGGGNRPGEVLLSAEEVAEYWGVTKTTVYRWCEEGSIPCLKIGRLWRVRRETLEYFPK